MCLSRLYDTPVFDAERACRAVVISAPKLPARAELMVQFEAALVKARQARIKRGRDMWMNQRLSEEPLKEIPILFRRG